MTDSDNHDSLSLFEASALPVLLIFFLALVLRLFRLSEISLGSDELALHFLGGLSSSYKVLKASRDWAHDWSPFYPFFSHWWPGSAASPFLFRLPSVLWGALTTLYLIKLGTGVFSRRSALIAGFLLAVSPWHIYISQEAGYGAFYAFLIMAQLWYFHLARSRPRYWLHFCLASLLGIYTSYSFIPFFILQIVVVAVVSYVFWFFVHKKNSGYYVDYFAKWFSSCFITFLGFYPWIILLSKRFPGKDPFEPPFSYRYPSWQKIVENLFSVGWVSLAVIVAVAVWGWYRKRKSAQAWELGLIALGGIPAALQLSYPINSHFIMRQLVYILPLALLFFACGIEGMITKYEAGAENRRRFWLVVLGGLLLFFNRGILRFDFDRITGFPEKPDWVETAKILKKDKPKLNIITFTESTNKTLWFHAIRNICLDEYKNKKDINFPARRELKFSSRIRNSRSAFLETMKEPFRANGWVVFYEPHLEGLGKDSFVSLLTDRRFGRYFQREIVSPQVYRYDFPVIVFDDYRLVSSNTWKQWGIEGKSARSEELGRISDGQPYRLRYMAFEKGDYCLTVIKKSGEEDFFQTESSLDVYNNDRFLGELRFGNSPAASLNLSLDGQDSTLSLVERSEKSPVVINSLNLNRLVEDYKFIRAGDFNTTSFSKKIPSMYRYFRGDWIGIIKYDGYIGYNLALKKSGWYRLVFCALHSKYSPISLRLRVDDRPVGEFRFAGQDRSWGVVESTVWLPRGFHEIRVERFNSISGYAVLKWLRVIREDRSNSSQKLLLP